MVRPKHDKAEMLHTCKIAALQIVLCLVQTCSNTGMSFTNCQSVWRMCHFSCYYPPFSIRSLELFIMIGSVPREMEETGKTSGTAGSICFFHLLLLEVIPVSLKEWFVDILISSLLFLVLSQNGEQCPILNKLAGYLRKTCSIATETQKVCSSAWTSEKTRRSKTKL